MFRNSILLVILSFSCVFSVMLFADDQKNTEVKFELISSIEPKELWSAIPQETIYSKAGAVIVFWGGNIENAVQSDDGWTYIGFIMAGLGDIAESPVAARVWSKNGNRFRFLGELSKTVSSGENEALAIFGDHTPSCEEKGFEDCINLLPVFKVNSLGAVFANGVQIGTVEE